MVKHKTLNLKMSLITLLEVVEKLIKELDCAQMVKHNTLNLKMSLIKDIRPMGHNQENTKTMGQPNSQEDMSSKFQKNCVTNSAIK